MPHTQHLVHVGSHEAVRQAAQHLQTPREAADPWTRPQAGRHLHSALPGCWPSANNPGPSRARVTPDPESQVGPIRRTESSYGYHDYQCTTGETCPWLTPTHPRCPYLGAGSLVGRAPRKGRGSPGRHCLRWIHKTSSQRTQGRTFLQRKQNTDGGEGEGVRAGTQVSLRLRPPPQEPDCCNLTLQVNN